MDKASPAATVCTGPAVAKDRSRTPTSSRHSSAGTILQSRWPDGRDRCWVGGLRRKNSVAGNRAQSAGKVVEQDTTERRRSKRYYWGNCRTTAAAGMDLSAVIRTSCRLQKDGTAGLSSSVRRNRMTSPAACPAFYTTKTFADILTQNTARQVYIRQ